MAAYVIGVEGLLANHRSAVMAPIALSAIIPVVLFLVSYRLPEMAGRMVRLKSF